MSSVTRFVPRWGRWRFLALFLVASGCRLLIAQSVPASDFESWTDRSGEFTVEARFLAIERDILRLARRDGTEIPVPMARLGAASAARARELAGLTEPALPLAEIRREEKNLVWPEKILPLYRRFLADENITPRDREAAIARFAELEKAAALGKLLLNDQFVGAEVLKKGSEKAWNLLIEADQLMMAREWNAATQKLEAASRSDPVSPYADLLLGNIRSIGREPPIKARGNYREALLRCRRFRNLLEGDVDALELAIVNNLALACMKQRELDESVRLWLEISQRELVPPTEMVHNIAHALLYASLADQYPAWDFFKSDAKKLRAQSAVFQKWAGITPQPGEPGWHYMWVTPIRNGQPLELPGIANNIDLHDSACLGCNGRGSLQCPNCVGNGSIVIRVPRPVRVGGIITSVEEVVIEPCPNCSARGAVDCPYCHNGSESLPR